jgi:hypothetical protein
VDLLLVIGVWFTFSFIVGLSGAFHLISEESGDRSRGPSGTWWVAFGWFLCETSGSRLSTLHSSSWGPVVGVFRVGVCVNLLLGLHGHDILLHNAYIVG